MWFLKLKSWYFFNWSRTLAHPEKWCELVAHPCCEVWALFYFYNTNLRLKKSRKNVCWVLLRLLALLQVSKEINGEIDFLLNITFHRVIQKRKKKKIVFLESVSKCLIIFWIVIIFIKKNLSQLAQHFCFREPMD